MAESSTTEAQAEPQQTSANSLVTEGSASQPSQSTQPEINFKDYVPEALRDEPSIKNINSIADLAKSYVSAQKMVGADKIQVPSKHATPEEWRNTFLKLGLPNEIEKYEITAKDVESTNRDFLDAFKKQAHQVGILPQQGQQLYDWYTNYVNQIQGQLSVDEEKSREKKIQDFKIKHGENFPTVLNKARMTVKAFGDPDLNAWLDRGAGDEPVVIEFLAKIGERLKEDQIGNVEATASFGLSPQQAAREIAEHMADKNGPYLNRTHPGHAEAVARVNELYRAKLNAQAT